MVSVEDQPAAEGGKERGDHSDSKVAPDGSNETADVATATAKDDEERRSHSSHPSSKKRRPGIQLNKDDHLEGQDDNSDGDDELNDEGGKRGDPFKRASEDVINKRKIVKVSSKWSSGTTGASGGSTFASVKLAPTATEKSEKDAEPSESNTTTSIFGSSAKITFGSNAIGATRSGFGSTVAKSGGFGSGFGSVSNGFGALKSASSDKNNSANDHTNSAPSKSTAFGGGFGAVSSGFGSIQSSTTPSLFGSSASTKAVSSPKNTVSTSSGSGLAGTFANSPKKSSPSKFPTSSVVDTANGEQDEDCICQVRAKLFKMVPDNDTPDTEEDSSALKGDVPSVPSTSGRMTLVKAKKEGEEESPKKSKESLDRAKESTAGKDGENKPKLVQKEAGIGPVRILKRKSPMILGRCEEAAKKPYLFSRVVQRQETSGGATRVILNVRLLPQTCDVIRRGDLFVQLNAPNGDGALESSLFKVKTSAEADTLENNLNAILEEA